MEDPLAEHYQQLLSLFGPDSQYSVQSHLMGDGYYWRAFVDDIGCEDMSWNGVVEKLKRKIPEQEAVTP